MNPSAGERVRHARIMNGLTQRTLAEMIGVSQPALSQIEKGQNHNPATLDLIAKHTGFARWFFDLGPFPDLEIGSLRYRKAASSTQTDEELVRCHVRLALDSLERKGITVDLPPVRLRPVGPDWTMSQDRLDALAAEARDALGVGPHDPIPNMVRAAERAGVVVFGYPSEIEKHDAVSYWPRFPGRPIICFSRGKSGDAQRFSVAHEIGHLLLHQLRNIDPMEAEKEAHQFAGTLLLPSEDAFAEIEPPVTLRDLAFVKARWGISIRALVKRCLDLRLIDERRRVSLEKQISSRGWRTTEPVEVPEESTLALPTLMGNAPMGKLGNELGLPPFVVRSLLAS